MAKLRVLLVDDRPDFLQSMADLFISSELLEVIGQSTSGSAALKAVGRLGPDLVLMDLAMPGMDGLEATRRIKRMTTHPRVVMLS